LGPGPSTTLLLWTTNPGCQGSAASSAPWIALGTPGVAGIYSYIPVTVAQNLNGYYLNGAITFTGTNFSQVFNVEQGVPSDFVGNTVSVSPITGNGNSQVFTIVGFPDGYSYLVMDVEFQGADSFACTVYFGTSATPTYAASTTSTSYTPAALNPGSTYYWQ